MMKIVITGGTGFIGRYIVDYFLKANENTITVLTRNVPRARKLLPENVRCVAWDGKTLGRWVEALNEASVVIHLAGHTVAGIWTVGHKQKIYKSRIDSTRVLIKALHQVEKKPQILFQFSATGFYGSRGEEILTEESDQGRGFLAAVVENWEAVSREVEEWGMRRVVLRAGVVLGNDGGILPLIVRSMRWFLGGIPGDGMNWLPWVHVKEIPQIIHYLYDRKTLNGVFNCVAPEPVRFETFCRSLGKLLRRPCWLKVPEFALQWLPGHQGEEMILVSQRVVPQRLVRAGYTFHFPTLYVALAEILERQEIPDAHNLPG